MTVTARGIVRRLELWDNWVAAGGGPVQTSLWTLDCSKDPPAIGWTRRGGAAATCIGSSPVGLRVSGGNYWALRHSLGQPPYPNAGWAPILGVGHLEFSASIPSLDGNHATPYWLCVFVNPGGFNWDVPAVGLRVLGDGSLEVANDHAVFGTSASGLIVAGQSYDYVVDAKAHDTAGSIKVTVDATERFNLTGLHTWSSQVGEDGYAYVGIGSNHTIDFYGFTTPVVAPTVLDFIDCRAQIGLNQDRLTVSIPISSQAGLYATARKIIRLIQNDTVFDEWKIVDRHTDRVQGIIILECATVRETELSEGALIYRQDSDGVKVFDFESVGLTPTEHINQWILPALSAAGFGWITLGTITPTAPVDMAFSWDSPLGALLRLAGTEYELDVRRNGTSGYLIDIV